MTWKLLPLHPFYCELRLPPVRAPDQSFQFHPLPCARKTQLKEISTIEGWWVVLRVRMQEAECSNEVETDCHGTLGFSLEEPPTEIVTSQRLHTEAM